MLETTEDRVALALVILGSVILGGVAVMGSGAVSAVLALLIYGIYTVISVATGVGAAFVTAWLFGVAFGLVGPAILRFAGIIVFTSAVAVAVPFGGLLGLIIYIALLMWFFELEIWEVIVFTLVLWSVRFVMAFALVAMLSAGAALS